MALVSSEILLNQQDASRFVNSLLHPEKNDQLVKNNDIILEKTKNGFYARVENLDLSFVESIE